MTDLVLANPVQLTGHALVMLWLMHCMESLRGQGPGHIAMKALAASLVMWGLMTRGAGTSAFDGVECR